MSDIVKFTKDSLFQRIKAARLDPDFKLTDEEQQRYDRLYYIYSLRLKNKYSKHQSVTIAKKELKISQATAYRDYDLAMQIFGDLDTADKNAERNILGEAYWNLYQLAYKDKNIEQARKCLDSYKSLFNFDDNEVEIDPNKIQAHEYHIHLSREGNKVLRQTLSKGVVDFNSYRPTEDIEYEEVKDNDE